MIGVKVSLFFLTIIAVRFIFIYINDIGDKKIIKMKELIDFTDYLRIYSCDMKMPLEEILLKFNFKSNEIKNICDRLLDEVKNNIKKTSNEKSLSCFIKESAMTPDDFNTIFAEIIYYYGNTYSDILEKKLIMTIKEMEHSMGEYEDYHKEKKNLYNKVSILFGCLAAVILV